MPVIRIIWLSSVVPIVGLLVVIPSPGIKPVFEMGIAVVDARSSSNSRDSSFDLSVQTLHGNESQSTYHKRNQGKLFHSFDPLSFFLPSFYRSFLSCKKIFIAPSLNWRLRSGP